MYVARHAERLRERGIAGPREDLPWIALVDALIEDRRVVELDHRTFPEDVMDELDDLRTMPKRRGRWRWAADIDEGTATSDFLALIAHRVPLVIGVNYFCELATTILAGRQVDQAGWVSVG